MCTLIILVLVFIFLGFSWGACDARFPSISPILRFTSTQGTLQQLEQGRGHTLIQQNTGPHQEYHHIYSRKNLMIEQCS